MAKFKIEMDDGKKYTVEADKKPTPEEVIDYLGQGGENLLTKATEEQFLPWQERLSGGIRTEKDLQRQREQQRTERGVASGTPLEPTGFNLRNLLDLPADIADMIGPAFPIVGATIGGTVAGAGALPTGLGSLAAVAGLGAVGGGGGQFLRQRIGASMGFDQGEVIEQLGNIVKEGAYGAGQEVGGVFISRAVNATKLGLLKAADNLIKHRGMEGFVKGFGSIATHLDTTKTQFALDAVKRGDRRVLSSLFANKNFADDFAKKLFFGADDNLAKQMYTLAHRKGAKEPVKAIYKNFLGISDDVFETVFEKGMKVSQYDKPFTLFKLADRIKSGLDDTFTKAGNELKQARNLLAQRAKNIDVSKHITQANISLADELFNVGFLVKEGDGLFSINPSYAGLQTGTAQAKTFGQLVSRFFGTESDDALIMAARRGDITAIQKLASKGRTGRAKVFNVKNDIKFGDFIDKLKQIDVQISGDEFKRLGQLSPTLRNYLKGLRDIPIAVEQSFGGSQVATLTNAFRELAEGSSLLRQGSKVKNVGQIETALSRLTGAKTETTAFRQAGELNKFLQQHLKVDFLDDLKSFKAAQAIKEIKKPMGDLAGRKKVVGIMKNAFREENLPMLNELTIKTDPFLPASLKIAEHAKIHTTAEALHVNAASLFRARCLFNALLSGTMGGMVGGPAGTGIGITAGMLLQNPGILKTLIKTSAALSNKEIGRIAATPISKATAQATRLIPAGGRLLKELMKAR